MVICYFLLAVYYRQFKFFAPSALSTILKTGFAGATNKVYKHGIWISLHSHTAIDAENLTRDITGVVAD